jgi:hypothetical protein
MKKLSQFAALMILIISYSNFAYCQESPMEYSFFPEGYYSSLAYTNMAFVDNLKAIAGEAMPQFKREAFLDVLPHQFAEKAESCLIVSYGPDDISAFVVSIQDPVSTISKSLKKKEIIASGERLSGKKVFKFVVKTQNSGNELDIYFVIYNQNILIGAEDINTIRLMIETHQGQRPDIFSTPYYQEFRNLLPDLGGVILANFDEYDLVESIESDYQNKKISQEEYDKLKLYHHLGSKYDVYTKRIIDGIFQTELKTYYYSEEGAQEVFRSYANIENNGITQYHLEGSVISIKEVFTKKALEQTKKQRLQWEAEARKKTKAKKGSGTNE